MVAFRRYHPLSLALVLALLASSPVVAMAGEAGLYDQPVLALDPGMHTAMISSADVSATGAYTVTGSEDNTVRLWDAQKGRLLRTIRLPQGPGHVGKVYAVAISPDGALVAAGGQTTGAGQPEHIYLFTRDMGALVRRLTGLPYSVSHLVFSPTGRYLAATLGDTHGLRVYDRDAEWREVARDTPYGDDSSGAWRRCRPRTAHNPLASPSPPGATGWPSAMPTRRPSRSSTGAPSPRCSHRIRAGSTTVIS
jgi:WD40 repeat protein